MAEDEDRSSETTTFSLTYSLDNDHCFRRECPSCSRQFKTEADEGDLVSVIRPVFQRAGLDVGAASDGNGEVPPASSLHCPYCGHESTAADMLTAQFGDYLERYVMREYILPKVNGMLSDFSDEMNKSSRRTSGGLIGISIESNFSRDILPPRPISGPEPNDMTRVLMICCGRRIKLLEGWAGELHCPFCGQPAALQ